MSFNHHYLIQYHLLMITVRGGKDREIEPELQCLYNHNGEHHLLGLNSGYTK